MTRAVGFSLTHSHSSRFPVPASFVPYFSLLVLCIAHPLFKSLDPALCSGPRSFVHPPPSPSFHLIYVHFVCIGWCCFLYFSFVSWYVGTPCGRPPATTTCRRAPRPIKKRFAQATFSSHLLPLTASNSLCLSSVALSSSQVWPQVCGTTDNSNHCKFSFNTGTSSLRQKYTKNIMKFKYFVANCRLRLSHKFICSIHPHFLSHLRTPLLTKPPIQ